MPIKHAALKQLRKDRVRTQRNRAVRSELRTLTKRLAGLLKSQKVEEAKALLQEVSGKLDRAAAKGVIHRNAAARNKSRLAHRLNQLSPASRG